MDANNDIAAPVGFNATKDFLSCRRAMRPVVGDVFITNREGYLIFSQVDWIAAGEIGVGRFYVQGGTPISFARFSLSDWPEAVMKALRIGAEFRAAPVLCPECAGAGGEYVEDDFGDIWMDCEACEGCGEVMRNAKPHPGRDEADHGTTA